MIKLNAGGATDVGTIRTENQDEYSIGENTFIVADGMGGHLGGEVASSIAVESLKKNLEDKEPLTSDELVAAANAANQSVFERAQTDPNLRGMGTTLTALAPISEGNEQRVAIVHVGDSRAYLLRDGILQQVTNDHSWVGDMVRMGQMSQQEAETHPRKNILTRALGVDASVEPDLVQVLPLVGDRFLLCSDGLVREVTDDQIASVMRRLASPEEAARELVARAREEGGQDNITVLIVDVTASDVDPDAIARGEVAHTTRAGVVQKHDEPVQTAMKSSAEARPAVGKPILTVRVVVFFLLIALVVGGSLLVYISATNKSFFVTTKSDELVIYKGRPGGSLGFKPKLAEHLNKSITDIPPAHRDEITSGKVFSSKGDAEKYVNNLVNEEATLGIQPSDSTTTIAATTTTVTSSPK